MHSSRTLAAVAIAALIAGPAIGQAPDVAGLPARPVPAWVRDGVIYEVFPRAFSAQGNLAGVTARLAELRSLGVTILWLMPIHPIGQERRKGTLGSPYAVRDYEAVNPDYGTKDDLKRLVSEAHLRGLKVILDVVLNHTAWDSVLMKQPELYTRDARGRIVPPLPDWSDVADLDYGNPRLREYMIGMLKRWMREADLDGFRCDVAGMVPTDFWERARAELEALKPDILLLAEAHEPELLVKAFDLDYDWPLLHALDDVIAKGAPASRLREVREDERARFPRGALHMRFTDNHDERRAIARYGERPALAAAAFVFTLDGVPMLYNGMEVGDTTESGAPALFESVPVLWPIAERRPEFPRVFRDLIALRRSHPALRSDALEWLRNSDEGRVASYLRRASGEELLVAINLSNRPWTGVVEAGGGFEPLLADPWAEGAEAALPSLSLEAWGFRVFARAAR